MRDGGDGVVVWNEVVVVVVAGDATFSRKEVKSPLRLAFQAREGAACGGLVFRVREGVMGWWSRMNKICT